MKSLAIALDITAFVLGLVAAWYWLKASQIEVKDPFPNDGVYRNVETTDFVFPTMNAVQESAKLNKIAARVTAATVIVSTLGNLASQWPLW